MKLHLNPMKMKILATLEFEVETPVHVGVGGEEVVRELIRLPSGEIVIPSSTWKGAFRSLSEQVAKQTDLKGLSGLAVKLYAEGIGYKGKSEDLKEEFNGLVEDFVKALQGGDSKIVPHRADGLKSLLMELGYSEDDINEVKAKGLNAREALPQRMTEEYLALHCPIGKLYGNMVVAGKARFVDTLINTTPELRPGVGIDRKSGKAMERILYFINVIPRGPIELRMIVDNLLPDEDDSKIFASTLEIIETLGISIGARKSAGLGSLRLSKGEFRILDLVEDGKSKGFIIGNPFKKAKLMNLKEFVKWLQT